MDWKNPTHIASVLFCVLVAAVGLLLFFRYLFPILLPFLLSYLLTRAFRPLANRLSRAWHLPLSPIAVLLFLLPLLLFGALLWWGIFSLGRALLSLAEGMLSNGSLTELLHTAEEALAALAARWGLGGEHISLSALVERAANALLSYLPAFLSSLLSSLPRILFFLLLSLISGVYFCTDVKEIERAERWAYAHLPPRVRTYLSRTGKQLRHDGGRCLGAYFLLFVLTSSILLLGFWLLGIEHAPLLALLISLADLLPVIGVGTVLLPWAVLLFLSGQGALGWSLLVLYLIVSLLRQLAEPRLLGAGLGIPPLLSLLVTYASLCLFGLWGVLLSPIAVILVKALLPKKGAVTFDETEKARREKKKVPLSKKIGK